MPTTDDFLTLRADCRAKGWPADHAYWAYEIPSAPVEPLAISLTEGQRHFMREYTPMARAQSDANIRAMMAR